MARMDLSDDLIRLGVRPGDLVMVHASLRRLGLARSAVGDDGADLLLDALEAAVGPAGTLMMVLGSHYDMDWVNERPVGERAALLAGSAPFVHATAPAMTDVGWLAEAFRRRPGTVLSTNPSGRFGARGARAAELMADQPWNDYYGPGSPLDKLCAWGGRVLRFGADPDTVTVLHYAEYLADLPDKRRTRWDYLVEDAEGPRHVWVECLNDNEGIADYVGEDYFAVILKAYLALGRHGEGWIRRAKSELIDAADLVEFGARWMERNLA
jgi:aminoglycoside 3-N-acetyltransferase